MSVSLTILTVLIILIMLGAGQRILDNLRLSDKEAILILVLIVIGILIPPVWIGKYFCFSIGGFLIPFALSVYLLISCGWSRDLLRSVLGTILVGGAIYGLTWLLPADPEKMVVDNSYVYGLVAGVIAYLLGRSRRNAFVSCFFGLVISDLVQWMINYFSGIKSVLSFGVGGIFGTYIISIIISVAVCEFIGRCFTNAKKENDKIFNFKTHTFDSVENGKLNENENSALIRGKNMQENKKRKSTKLNKEKASKEVK